MKKTLRVFVAVEVTGAIRARAMELIAMLTGNAGQESETVGASISQQVKWVEPHNLHLTLKFLGDVHQREISRVCQSVGAGAGRTEPFEFEIRGAGAFPNVARPRTVWLGAGQGTEAMVALHGRVEAALAELGFRREQRRFLPHLTLGRVRGAGPGIVELGRRLEKQSDFFAGRMTVAKVSVFSSTLRPDGPIYELLASAPLGT